MDIALRDTKDGFPLVRELKANERYREIPVIILSAFSSTRERQYAMDAGAALFMTKPANAQNLIETVESMLPK